MVCTRAFAPRTSGAHALHGRTLSSSRRRASSSHHLRSQARAWAEKSSSYAACLLTCARAAERQTPRRRAIATATSPPSQQAARRAGCARGRELARTHGRGGGVRLDAGVQRVDRTQVLGGRHRCAPRLAGWLLHRVRSASDCDGVDAHDLRARASISDTGSLGRAAFGGARSTAMRLAGSLFFSRNLLAISTTCLSPVAATRFMAPATSRMFCCGGREGVRAADSVIGPHRRFRHAARW
jgi:hypothetical protein